MRDHIIAREYIFKVLRCSSANQELVEDAYRVHCNKDIKIESCELKQKPMSLEEKFYTYALLDPRKQGEFYYEYYGESLKFEFQPFYIGKGNHRRKNSHSEMARRNPAPVCGDHKGNIIRELHRNGLEPIIVELSRNEVEGMAFAREIRLISVIGRSNIGKGPLANMTDGGEGGSGTIPTEKWKEAIMKANVGRVKTPEELKRLSEALKGRKFSKETLSKMKASAALRIHGPHSEETKEKISAAQKGKPKSDQHRKNMSESAKKRLPRRHSEETKEKMRQAALNRKSAKKDS